MTKKEIFLNTVNLCIRENKSLYIKKLVSEDYIGNIKNNYYKESIVEPKDLKLIFEHYSKNYNEDLTTLEGRHAYEVIEFYAILEV